VLLGHFVLALLVEQHCFIRVTIDVCLDDGGAFAHSTSFGAFAALWYPAAWTHATRCAHHVERWEHLSTRGFVCTLVPAMTVHAFVGADGVRVPV